VVGDSGVLIAFAFTVMEVASAAALMELPPLAKRPTIGWGGVPGIGVVGV
jgi:hypothetical protein